MVDEQRKRPRLLIAAILSIASIAFPYSSGHPAFQVTALALWIAAVTTVLLAHRSSVPEPAETVSAIELISVTAFAALLRLSWLELYPFPTVGEEIRDTGLAAREILGSQSVNLFGWAKYQAHGMLTALSATPFELILGPSVLSLRLPTALLGILEVPLLTWIAASVIGRRGGLFVGLILSLLPLHLYVGRTQLVLGWSSIIASISIGVFSNSRFTRQESDRILLSGLLFGVALGFHAALRPVLLIMSMYAFYRAGGCTLNSRLRQLVAWCFGCFVGAGPKLLHVTLPILLHQKRHLQPEQLLQTDEISLILQLVTARIADSYRVFLDLPLVDFSPAREPLLPLLGTVILLIGVLRAARSGHPALHYAALLFFIVPITNSALTNRVNAAHRLVPLLPVIAILCGTAATWLLHVTSKIRPALTRWLVSALAALVILAPFSYESLRFFILEFGSKGVFRASRSGLYQDFLARYLAESPVAKGATTLCIVASKDDARYFRLLHVREHFAYLLPGRSVTVGESDQLQTGEVALLPTCPAHRLSLQELTPHELCTTYQRWLCSFDGIRLRIYSEKQVPSAAAP
jgi:hypothetical protein